MHIISRDSPCYFLTSVAKDRLPVFRTDEIKDIACQALDEARKSGKFALYAYVIMPDHLHAITDSARSSEDTLRFMNGIIGHRVIAHLKERGYESSLQKLRQETKPRQYRHSLWDHHPNVRLLLTEEMLMERVHYLHQNPVRAGLVERAESTATQLNRHCCARALENHSYDFWLNVLDNREPGNFRGMVCSFITSTEYQKRFSSVVTHSNAECGR